MIKKYLINKITVTTICIILLSMFYILPSNNIQLEIENDNISKIKKEVYLLDKDNYVSKVTYFFDEKSIEEEIIKRVEILKNGLETYDIFYPLIPVNTKVNDIIVEKNNVYINFSEEILNVKEYLEEPMIEAIVYTLTEINGIENIYIKVNDKILDKMPNSRKSIKYPLTRNIGINKEYNLNDLKNVEKTTIVFSKTEENFQYYVPITLINNDDNDKIKIIIEELKSAVYSQNNLNGYINSNLELEEYNIENGTMELVFNENIYISETNKMIPEDTKNVISESIFENYDINKIILNTKKEKNIIKIEETP